MPGADCPRCGHGEFFAVDTVESPHYEFSNSMRPLTLTGFYGPIGESSFFGGERARMVVELTAFVCRGCRAVAWFVKDAALLEQMASEGRGVAIVRGLPTPASKGR